MLPPSCLFATPPRSGPTRPGEPRDTWTVFDPDGNMLGSVDVPYGLTILDIGADYVLGSALNELQLERIELYRLIKP